MTNIKNLKPLSASAKKTQFTRIGLGLAGIAVNDATAELIWRTMERIEEKKGGFSVHDGVELEFLIRKKYKLKDKK